MKIALGLGSSLGHRRGHLERTLWQLAAKPDLTLLRTSRWYRTPPMRGGSARGFFLNGVALFESRCSPHAFMRYCVELEAAAGRRRSKHWGDRTLDLDILLAGDWILDDPALNWKSDFQSRKLCLNTEDMSSLPRKYRDAVCEQIRGILP